MGGVDAGAIGIAGGEIVQGFSFNDSGQGYGVIQDGADAWQPAPANHGGYRRATNPPSTSLTSPYGVMPAALMSGGGLSRGELRTAAGRL
jgi:hypothetical protein